MAQGRCLFALALALVAYSGCGGSGVTLYPVTGTVVYRGEPVEGATVTFRNEEARTIATVVTDAQGGFELTTYGTGKGAAPGRHVVTVTKVAGLSADAAADEPLDAVASMEAAVAESSGDGNSLPEEMASAARRNRNLLPNGTVNSS